MSTKYSQIVSILQAYNFSVRSIHPYHLTEGIVVCLNLPSDRFNFLKIVGAIPNIRILESGITVYVIK